MCMICYWTAIVFRQDVRWFIDGNFMYLQSASIKLSFDMPPLSSFRLMIKVAWFTRLCRVNVPKGFNAPLVLEISFGGCWICMARGHQHLPPRFAVLFQKLFLNFPLFIWILTGGWIFCIESNVQIPSLVAILEHVHHSVKSILFWELARTFIEGKG